MEQMDSALHAFHWIQEKENPATVAIAAGAAWYAA